jgi:hypothetical protein
MLNYAMKTYMGLEVQVSSSWPLQEMEASGQLRAPAACLDAVEKRKISPLPGIAPLAVQPVARHSTNWAILPSRKL